MTEQHNPPTLREPEQKQELLPPAAYRLVASEEELLQKMEIVAQDITNWIRSSLGNRQHSPDRREVIVAPVMRGALYFAADLTRKLGESVEIQPVRVSSYAGNSQQKHSTELQINLETLQPQGRRILIVDDICDSGRTIALLTARLVKEEAAEVKSAVLVHRDLPQTSLPKASGSFNPHQVQPDFALLRFSGHEWLAGYGLDDEERYRNLRGVYAIPTPST